MSNLKMKSLTALVLLMAGAAYARADADEHAYTWASFHGDYAVVGTGGANAAGLLGTIRADGLGTVSGSALANLPGSSARTLVNITYSGTYTINPDGTGVITVTVTLPSGRTAAGDLDVLITLAKDLHGEKLATLFARDVGKLREEFVPALANERVELFLVPGEVEERRARRELLALEQQRRARRQRCPRVFATDSGRARASSSGSRCPRPTTGS